MKQTEPYAQAQALAQGRQAGPEFCREVARKAGDRPAGLPVLVERIRNLVLANRVSFYLEVHASLNNGRLRLTGATERPEFKRIYGEVFRHLGYRRVDNAMEVLPDPAANPEPYGIVTAPHLLTYARPDLAGLAMDDALWGEPVYVLKEEGDICLIKTFSGYWGFAKRSGLRRLGQQEFVRLLNAPKVCLCVDCEIDGVWLPAGAQPVVREWPAGRRCRIAGPNGESLWLPKSQCRRMDTQRDIARVVAQARTFLQAPYLMGGKSRRDGIDCSGLVQMSFRAIGLNLPRDAHQQYLAGHLILPGAAAALRPGDAMFFMGDNGQVDHVALYVGRNRALHATGTQEVRVQDLDPASANHLRRYPSEFIGAKRFIG